MITWVLGNTAVAAVLAVVAALLCRGQSRRPALCHLIWLVVLVALVAPPLPVASLPGTTLRDGLGAWIEPTPVADDARLVEPDVAAASVAERPTALSPAGIPDASPTERMPAPAASAGWSRWLAALSAETWLLLLWAAGSLVALGWQAAAVARFRRRLAVTRPAPAPLLHAVDDLARRLGVRAPTVALVDGLGTPAVWCLGAPRLLWPAGASVAGVGNSGSRPGERALVAHELAHIARRDHWVARLESVATVVLWWHPLLWLVRRQVHGWSELSADAWALWAEPDHRRAFAEALIEAQTTPTRSPAPPPLQGLCATGRDIQDFERRLTMIMTTDVSRRVPRAGVALALAACLAVLPGFSDETSARAPQDAALDPVACQVRDHVLASKAEQLFTEGRFEQAYQAFVAVAAARPDDGKAQARLGYLLIGRGEYDAALVALERQLELGHLQAVAAYNIGCARSLMGQPQAALAALQQAVALGFHDARLMATDGDLDAARSSDGFAAILKATLRSDELHEDLDVEWDSSPATLDRLTERGELVHAHGELQHKLGLKLLGAGRVDAALAAFERQAAAGYAPANAHYNLACAQALSGQRESALDSLERAAALGMVHASVRDDADLASLVDEPRFAAAAAQIAAPGDTLSSLKQALMSGDLAAASALYEQAGSFAEPNSWAAMTMGQLLLENGQAERAQEQFVLALEAGHAADDAVFQLASAKAAAGDESGALAALDDALTLGFADGERVAQLLERHGLGDAATRLALLQRAEQQAQRADAYAGDRMNGRADAMDQAARDSLEGKATSQDKPVSMGG